MLRIYNYFSEMILFENSLKKSKSLKNPTFGPFSKLELEWWNEHLEIWNIASKSTCDFLKFSKWSERAQKKCKKSNIFQTCLTSYYLFLETKKSTIWIAFCIVPMHLKG